MNTGLRITIVQNNKVIFVVQLEDETFWWDLMWGTQVYCSELPICCYDSETPKGKFVLPNYLLLFFSHDSFQVCVCVFVCALVRQKEGTERVCLLRCRTLWEFVCVRVLTWLLACQQTDTLWPEPNKASSPVCGLWRRLYVSPPRGQCHADLRPLEQSAVSTRLVA